MGGNRSIASVFFAGEESYQFDEARGLQLVDSDLHSGLQLVNLGHVDLDLHSVFGMDNRYDSPRTNTIGLGQCQKCCNGRK